MSWKILAKVYERKVGSQIKKAVMTYCADKASDDGRGIWASKNTIAAELEAGRSTIIRTINELVSEGILVPEGGRKCANGSTVEYRIDVPALESLPPITRPNTRPVPERDQSRKYTGPDRDPSQSGTPPVPERDPDPSQSGTQTSLGTSLEPVGVAARVARQADGDVEAWSDDRLLEEVQAAVGIRGPQVPTYWLPPGATKHVARWRRDLDLDAQSIVDAARATRSRHSDPPRGPKALDSTMKHLAAEQSAPAMKPHLSPNPGGRNDRSEQRHREDQATDEYIRRRAAGEIDLGPDPSDPFAGK